MSRGVLISVGKKITKKNTPSGVALQKLRSYLNAAEPEMVYFLVNTWKKQGKAITYKEIREALLNGDIDQAYLTQWQEDYSKFVKEHLEPAWHEAMSNATAEMAKKYPEWNFDPFADGVKSWTEQRAAEFVTNVSSTQIQGLRSVIQRAAVLEGMSVDHLSRAIRPMIGLTHQQSIANLNYYNKLLSSGMAEKKALDLSIRYSAKQHRYRAYNIARTELAFAYNQGTYQGIKQAQTAGYMGEVVKIWCTADDERVCEICGGLDGKTVAMDGEFGFNTKLSTVTTPTIKMVPPAHPGCRCTTIYEEVSPPDWIPTQPNPNHLPDAASELDDGPAASIPDGYEPPDTLIHTGPSYFSDPKHSIYGDDEGYEYLFKPAGYDQDGLVAYYKAYAQEAGYKVQYIVDPDTAVPVGACYDQFGKFGSIQKVVMGSNIDDELYKLYQGMDIDASLKSQLQREHVTDWLLANFDAHSKRFIADSTGKLVGVSKPDAFPWMKITPAKKMSYTYAPLSPIGHEEPVYNMLYKGFAKGDIDLDPNDVLPYIKRVESISNKEYREIFRAYAEDLYGVGKEAEELLDEIVERKINLRETFRTFFEELLEERSSGIKAVFKFADEGAVAAKQALSSQTLTKEAAMKMTSADLKKIAKDKGIPSFSNMTKEQLATCISDPTQISAMNAQVNEKLRAQAARRRAAQSGQETILEVTQGKYTVTNGVYRANELFDDFSAIPRDKKLGITAASDSTMVEGQALTFRRVKVNGQDYIEISGKLTETVTEEIDNALMLNAREEIIFGRGPLTDGIAALDDNDWLTASSGIRFKNLAQDVTIEVITDKSLRSLAGTLRIRVIDTGDAVADAAKVKRAIKTSAFSQIKSSTMDMEHIFDSPTKADEDTLKKARLIFQKKPDAAVDLRQISDKMMGIDALADQLGIDDKEIKALVKQEVYPGYYTYVNPGVHKTYKKAGFEYVWAGVSDEDSVAAMVKSGGMSSSLSRIKTGFTGNGKSVNSDIRTGGADNVFTRIATKGAATDDVPYSSSYASGNYQIVMKPSVMDRTDWFAYESDNYGDTDGSYMKGRPSSMDFVESQNNSYSYSNEVMFRHGIKVEDWAGIDCRSQTYKDRLMATLRANGITQINGINIERFIRINTRVGTPLK